MKLLELRTPVILVLNLFANEQGIVGIQSLDQLGEGQALCDRVGGFAERLAQLTDIRFAEGDLLCQHPCDLLLSNWFTPGSGLPRRPRRGACLSVGNPRLVSRTRITTPRPYGNGWAIPSGGQNKVTREKGCNSHQSPHNMYFRRFIHHSCLLINSTLVTSRPTSSRTV